jgi:hypothetical protein
MRPDNRSVVHNKTNNNNLASNKHSRHQRRDKETKEC